eukprot:1153749-Pelagomonas_calceolata.AAC.1
MCTQYQKHPFCDLEALCSRGALVHSCSEEANTQRTHTHTHTHAHTYSGCHVPMRSVVHPFCDLEALQQELLCTAAQEACVLLARVSATSSVSGPKRAYHGPARRLARTLVSVSTCLFDATAWRRAQHEGQRALYEGHWAQHERHRAQHEENSLCFSQAQHEGRHYCCPSAQHVRHRTQHEGDKADWAQHEGRRVQHGGYRAQHEGLTHCSPRAQHVRRRTRHEGDTAQHEGRTYCSPRAQHDVSRNRIEMVDPTQIAARLSACDPARISAEEAPRHQA